MLGLEIFVKTPTKEEKTVMYTFAVKPVISYPYTKFLDSRSMNKTLDGMFIAIVVVVDLLCFCSQ